jgi:hypothetical protein
MCEIIKKDYSFENSKKKVYNNLLLRFYNRRKALKVKNVTSDSTAPDIAQVEAGDWVCTVCNYLPKTTDVSTAGINYDYYITKAENMIHKINYGGKSVK